MKITSKLLFLFTFFSFLLGQVPFHHDPSVLKDPTGYKLRFGDRIRISVRGEADCSIESVINNDGKVEVIHIGEIFVAGNSVKQAQNLIEEAYQSHRIFARPNVKVYFLGRKGCFSY